jgi:tRNA U34 5-methylaminomethyl-2-thiouridine-forming methyltransferase MnmC
MQHQQAKLTWRDGRLPVSDQFDDPYFSLGDGLAETRYVFLDGNDLPARFDAGFHIAELGFGTGLNLLAAWKLWEDSGHTTPLRFTTFEAFPMARPDMIRAIGEFVDVTSHADRFFGAWDGGANLVMPTLELTIVTGDARQTLPVWDGRADAWFLDGFSPQKNPELWGAPLLDQVFAHTNPNGTAATYTAAGAVRSGLADAGFNVSRIAGFGRKRHMTKAIRT